MPVSIRARPRGGTTLVSTDVRSIPASPGLARFGHTASACSLATKKENIVDIARCWLSYLGV